MSLVAWIAAPLSLLFLVLLTHSKRLARERRRLPPGPKRLPLLGNAHQLPLEYQEETFWKWAKTYGEQ